MKRLAFPKRVKRPAVWNTKKCDAVFRDLIRQRDKRCVYPAPHDCKGGLQVSHFFSRRFHAVRWDEENVDLLCASAHWFLEPRKQTSYRSWKWKQLGEERYLALCERASAPRPSREVRAAFQQRMTKEEAHGKC